MASYGSNFWKKTPFVKLLLAMIAGIIVQWMLPISINTWWINLAAVFVVLVSFFFIPFFKRYKLYFINGILAGVIFFSMGAMLVWQHDITKSKQWLGYFYKEQDALQVTLDEPPVEKTKSFKANATVNGLFQNGQIVPVKGKIILYFSKDSAFQLSYGSRIIFKKPLQKMRNSGNPGGFDYGRYCFFQGITHQVYLQPGEFEVVDGRNENWLRKFIYSTREKVLNILRTNIKGQKELGLAEALLIGYKNDLDQSLVQSYTNTGVVHIIAISGLHLGLIYWLLALLLKPLLKRKKLRWLRPVLIITSLWLFSLLAGAQPSILRSALMFTCIVLGESLSKKTSIYNTMAVSAFILLCINPYWLWDVGFQLSYAAVLSIIIFMRPVYNWLYINNKVLDFIWKLNAVTIAAQIFTVPLSIYHFHQFPNYFLLTNFVAVPVSSTILLGEILLCIISFVPVLALLLGNLLTWLIRLMNLYVERIEALSYSVWEGLQVSLVQASLLILFTMGISYWLLERSTAGVKLGIFALLGFVVLRSLSFIQTSQQQKIIVYNVPQKRAIDFVNSRHYLFIGDSDLVVNEFARKFHLEPSRVLFRAKQTKALSNLLVDKNFVDYQGKHILLLDNPVSFVPQQPKPVIDLLVISKNPKLYIKTLATALDIKQVVVDGSVPAWRSSHWKKDCDSLSIPWHDVTVKGAFVMKLR